MKNEYILLDSGNLKKLEQVGPYRIIRPALNAFWKPALPEREWKSAVSEFVRDSSGNGRWHNREALPETWNCILGKMTIKIKPTSFGHLGFFAEQFRNWEYFRRNCRNMDTLNLFAYSGLGSLAMAAGGAKVCHIDAARGMIEWGRENHALNPDIPNAVRWIAEDVNRFCQRELRRNSKYDLIALDPPTFGRGPSGQLWKIETDLPKLLELCRQLRKPEKPFTLVLSCHSPGFSLMVLSRLVTDVFGKKCDIDGGEMFIPESTGRVLPAGIGLRAVVD
ncbi:MAG: class I SAM-dependent methyltransferase [Lentisphaeria bacterium]|nr:class I SAM-dependent methyltransferase [Lentisphaeria bacterium]